MSTCGSSVLSLELKYMLMPLLTVFKFVLWRLRSGVEMALGWSSVESEHGYLESRELCRSLYIGFGISPPGLHGLLYASPNVRRRKIPSRRVISALR